MLFIQPPTVTSRVLQNAIDDFIDNCTDLGKVFDEVQQEIDESNAVKVAAKNMKA